MKIIADSGSTKTQWSLIYNNKVETIFTVGLNPYHMANAEIEHEVRNEVASKTADNVDSVFFYGSGVTPQKRETMRDILRRAFGMNIEIEAESDMIGAARSLFADKSGIACILGTGANSCYYDGENIVANTPAMGYILGDEGSGACIGKHLVNALYKNPKLGSLRSQFEKEYELTQGDIIEKVYRQPMANKFLASLAPFAKEHIDNKHINSIIREEFADFFFNNLQPYPAGLPVGFIGSIAFHFSDQLQAVAKELGYEIATIAQSPMEGLINYHLRSTVVQKK